MKQASAEKILVIGPAWIGDMVMAQSMFILLKGQYPGCEITVMAPAWTEPLLARMPEVDATLDLPFKHGELALGARRKLGRSLKTRAFTRAIVLPNSFKSALVPFHAGIPVRSGWRGEMRKLLLTDCRKLDSNSYPLQVQRFAALAHAPARLPPADIPPPQLQVNKEQVKQALARFKL
ncbi:MAG: lipopolysaccharide heptosyltransferase II, partial [Gammaproteobacteria bacterium]